MIWPPINRDDLKVAAKRAGFDLMLPVLIRRLIAETSEALTELDMPGESGVAAGGFDGIVSATTSSAFVPMGTSVWELSVGGNDGKADEDYDKRTRGPAGRKARDCTYIEVILAPWTKSRLWASKKTALRRWREVRAYNLDRVHTWLDSAPATTVWLAGELGKAMPGVRSIHDWWEDSWLLSTEPQLGVEVVLAGRKDSSRAFLDQVTGGTKVISLGGNLRLDEAMAFIAASLCESDHPAASQFLARALLVSDTTSLHQLSAQQSPLVILLADLALARDLPSQHPHQLIVLAPPGDQSAVDVARLDSEVVTALLGDEVAARGLGFLARRSLLALRRRLALNPNILTPTWAIAPDLTTRRLSMLGSWRGDVEGDRVIVGRLVGDSYASALVKAESLRSNTDLPFLDRVLDEWYVVARDDAWNLISPGIDADDIREYHDVAIEVFTAANPVLELDPDERWKASWQGIHRPHSMSLRRGLAETAALLGASDQVVIGTSNKTSEYARSLVRRLVEEANADESYLLWESLADVVAFLAEAAPAEFLSAMRSGLLGDAPLQRQMFRDSNEQDGVFGSSSPHTNFLWALERLAWSPDYIDEVVRVLIGLERIDPGGRLSNRPRASLLGILSVWCPQTTAPLNDRLRCIKLIADHSERAFEILLALIPDGHPVQMSHPAPEFRDWRREAALTRAEVSDSISKVGSMLLKDFELTVERAKSLVARLNDFGADFRAHFIDRVNKLAASWTHEERAAVFEALRGLIAHHQEYADTNWALSADQLALLVEARDSLEPAEPAERYRWLFENSWITLGDLRRRDDHAAYEIEINSRRQAAIEELFWSGGLDAVLAFAEGVDPWIVGTALGRARVLVEGELLTLVEASEPSAAVAAGYFTARLRGEDYLADQLLANGLGVEAQAFILRHLPDQQVAITKLADLDQKVSEIYWKNFNYYGLGPEFTGAKDLGWNLLDAGRPVAAILVNLIYNQHELADEETAELFATALETLVALKEPDPEVEKLQRHELDELFIVLARYKDQLGAQRVATLEWQLMPLSGMDGRAPSLHAELKDNPAFFVELIVTCFHAASGPRNGSDPEDAETDEEMKKRSNAMRAWEVLRSCNQVPGVDESGELNAVALRGWVEAARTELKAVDRTEIGDLHIGELLSHSPLGSDGAPLPVELRELLEELGSAEIMRGIATGIYNSRGVTSRGMTEGGRKEWVIAGSYRRYAETARSWPLTRKLFEGIAEEYESEARREDISAERRRQGIR